jgi:PAS domain S-box-containing protein
LSTPKNAMRFQYIHSFIAWSVVAAVLYTDFLTPLGFAHGILYLPVLIYALSIDSFSKRSKKAVLLVSVLGTAGVYLASPYRLDIPELYIASNRLLSIVLLLLTYFYFAQLNAIKRQNTTISMLEQQQRHTLNDFMDSLPVQVWWATPSGVVDFVGRKLVEFTGQSKEKILADWLSFLHPDDRANTTNIWMHSIQTGESYDVNFRLKRHDGEYIWFHTQAVAQRNEDGNIQRWLGSSMDIDELLKVTEQSERLAAKFRHTVESITDAFFTLDQEFRFTYLNHRAAEIRGGTIEDFLGEVIWDKCEIGYDSPFGEKYRLAAKTNEKLYFEEYFAPGDRWLDVNVYPSEEGLTVYFSDITERKELERRLRESQKLEAIGHLTGGVAHDFNNLLTVIMGNAEMLSEQLTDPILQPMAAMTLSAAQRGADLTSRLLAFARRKPLDPRQTDINKLLKGTLPLFRRTLPENIELEFKTDTKLAITEIDGNELDNALLNLVVNARDAMPDGGKLTIETANIRLDELYSALYSEVLPGDYVMVAVSDTGLGMTPETVRRAFEPFFTTKEIGKGSGLGLSMVFGFAKQSGGHANIYSEFGEGTTIKLYFPKSTSSSAVIADSIVNSELIGGSEHILIAEDDELVRRHLQQQLRILGYEVTSVSSGPQALEALATNDGIHLLLTDIIMPGGMNGRQLADKAMFLYPSLKVLYTSGYTENAIVHHGRLDKGLALLSKPYTRIELSTKLRQVLDSSNV